MGLEELILTTERKRAERRGMERGIERRNREVVMNMIQKNFTDEMIVDIAGVPLEYVREIKYVN